MASYIFLALSSGLEQPHVINKVLQSRTIIGSLEYTKAQTRYDNLLRAFLENPTYIWSLRGGFGISPVLALLEKNNITPPSKSLIVGYSDITILHLWARKHQHPTIHGIMPYFCKQTYTAERPKSNYKSTFSFNPLPTKPHKVTVLYNPQKLSQSVSTVIGGNLACVHSQIGTPTEMQGTKQIIFLEDDKYSDLSLIKTMLSGLISSGTFDNADGIFLGDIPAVHEIASLLHEKLPHLWIIHSPRFGHGDYCDFLPMGYETTIDLKKGSMSFNYNRIMPYLWKNREKSVKKTVEKINIYDLFNLCAQHKISFKGILTLPYTEHKLRLIRHLINLYRNGALKDNVKIDGKILPSLADRQYCAQEIWDVVGVRIKWIP